MGKSKESQLNWKSTKRERAWYFLGRVGNVNLQAMVPNLMNMFLIFNGVDLALIATITLIVKIIDAADDMIFGFLIDKLDLKKTKLLRKIGGEGRYLPWLRCFMYFFPTAVLLFFLMPSSLSQMGKIVWFAVTYLLYDVSLTLVDVPFQSSLMTFTDVPEERNHMITVGYVVVTLVVIVAGAVQNVLISESVGMSIRNMALLCVIIFSAMMIPMPFKVKERNTEVKNGENNDEYTLREMFRAIKGNKPFLMITLAGLFPGILATNAALTLFVSYYLYGSSTAMVIPTLIATFLMVAAEAVSPKFTRKLGNKRTIIVMMMIACVCSFATFFIGYKHFPVVVVSLLLSSFTGGVVLMVRGYIGLQCIDYGKYMIGRDTTGIFNAIYTLVGKVTGSIASSLGLILLGVFGWISVNAESFADLAAQNVLQPTSALNGLWIINTLIPAVGTLLGLICMRFYTLEDEDARLMGMCTAGEISREECENRLSRKYN